VKVAVDSARQASYVDSIVIHESFRLPSNDFDIAVLQLVMNLTLDDYVQPICLPTLSVAANTNCVATGWGYTKRTNLRLRCMAYLNYALAHTSPT